MSGVNLELLICSTKVADYFIAEIRIKKLNSLPTG